MLMFSMYYCQYCEYKIKFLANPWPLEGVFRGTAWRSHPRTRAPARPTDFGVRRQAAASFSTTIPANKICQVRVCFPGGSLDSAEPHPLQEAYLDRRPDLSMRRSRPGRLAAALSGGGSW